MMSIALYCDLPDAVQEFQVDAIDIPRCFMCSRRADRWILVELGGPVNQSDLGKHPFLEKMVKE